MNITRDCPASKCDAEISCPSVFEVDMKFQEHMQTEHLEDGEYHLYLTKILGVMPKDAAKTVKDARANQKKEK